MVARAVVEAAAVAADAAARLRGSTAADLNNPYAKMAPLSRPPYDAITKPENPSRFDGKQITQTVDKANGQHDFIPGPASHRVYRVDQCPRNSTSSGLDRRGRR